MPDNTKNVDFFYPFAAIVGQELMKTALILNAIDFKIGGVLIKGVSGTAKSTAVRALAALLPEVEVVADCPFQCDPWDHRLQCDICRKRRQEGENLPVRKRLCSLVNLPLNATEDRVAGTLDITHALRDGIKALQPGLLAEANRGILYIDEINLLDDHIVNLLLDPAALGINTIEREGLSLIHPARFMLIGTMNPQEGELRPQIADRIGLQVEVRALTEQTQRVEVMKRTEAFNSEPNSFLEHYRIKQEELRKSIRQARALLPQMRIPERFYGAIAYLSVKSDVMSHRADITILRCAKAMAAFQGRTEIQKTDILEAAVLTLGHRIPNDPFVTDVPQVEPLVLRHHLEDILESKGTKGQEGVGNPVEVAVPEHDPPGVRNGDIDAQSVFQLPKQRIVRIRSVAGMRDQVIISPLRGKYSRSRLFRGSTTDIAVAATLRAAATRLSRKNRVLELQEQDLREKIRKPRSHYIIVFVVDNSWSIQVKATVEKSKGVILDLLKFSSRFHDKVGMVAFRNTQHPDATICLLPTKSYSLAADRLREIPLSGTTPLPDGILKALNLLRQETFRCPNALPVMVIVTDGLPNVALRRGGDPRADVTLLSRYARLHKILTLVVDVDSFGSKEGRNNCREMARLSGGKYLTLQNMTRQTLAKVLSASRSFIEFEKRKLGVPFEKL